MQLKEAALDMQLKGRRPRNLSESIHYIGLAATGMEGFKEELHLRLLCHEVSRLDHSYNTNQKH